MTLWQRGKGSKLSGTIGHRHSATLMCGRVREIDYIFILIHNALRSRGDSRVDDSLCNSLFMMATYLTVAGALCGSLREVEPFENGILTISSLDV